MPFSPLFSRLYSHSAFLSQSLIHLPIFSHSIISYSNILLLSPNHSITSSLAHSLFSYPLSNDISLSPILYLTLSLLLSPSFSFFLNYSHTLQWRQNDHGGVSNHQPHGCLLNRLFRRRSKKTSKLRVTGFCAGNSPGTGEFPAQMTSYAEDVSIWLRHHDWLSQADEARSHLHTMGISVSRDCNATQITAY